MQIANEALVATLTARIDLLTHQNERMKSLLHQTRIDADFRLAQEKAESEKLAAKVKRLERDLNVPIPGHLKTPTQLSRRNKQLQYSLDVMNQSNQKYVSQLQEAEAEKRRLLQQVARLEQQIRDDSQIGDRENIIGLKESFELLWTEKRHGADRKPGLRLKENVRPFAPILALFGCCHPALFAVLNGRMILLCRRGTPRTLARRFLC
jgi:hypothetical protein